MKVLASEKLAGTFVFALGKNGLLYEAGSATMSRTSEKEVLEKG